MTETKRLAVIYVRLTRDEFTLTSSGEVRDVHLSRYTTGDVEYLPRVACRDCPHFQQHPHDAEWMYCSHDFGLGGAPYDGSGFCHLHPQLAHLIGETK